MGNSSEIVNQSRPFAPSIPAFTSGVRAITKSVVITMEWFDLMHRCTARSLGAMQILLRCRTPGEFFTAQSNLLFGNLDDAFEGVNKLLLETAGNQRRGSGDKE